MDCPDCGVDHHPELAEAAAEVDAAEVIAEGAEGAAHEEASADVRVAEIQADRDVEVARIQAKVEQGWQEERVVALEARLAGMQEVLETIAPPPAPAAEPEPEPAPEVIEEEPPAPEEAPQQAPPAPKKSKGWWG